MAVGREPGGGGAPTGGGGRPSRRPGNAPCPVAVRNGGANIAGVMAVGRDVPIAPHRPVAVGNARVIIAAQRGTRISRGMPCRAPRRWRGGAMGTSRPTATGHDHGTQAVRTTTGHGQGAASGHPTAPTGRPMPCSAPRPPVPCALAPIGTKGSGFSAPNEDFRRISEQDGTGTVALRSGPCYPRCVAYLDRIVVWIGNP